MEKLKKIKLSDVEVMTPTEMKQIKGGSFTHCYCDSNNTHHDCTMGGACYNKCVATCNGGCECWY